MRATSCVLACEMLGAISSGFRTKEGTRVGRREAMEHPERNGATGLCILWVQVPLGESDLEGLCFGACHVTVFVQAYCAGDATAMEK